MKKKKKRERDQGERARNRGMQRIVGNCWELDNARALPWKQKRVVSCQQLLSDFRPQNGEEINCSCSKPLAGGTWSQ